MKRTVPEINKIKNETISVAVIKRRLVYGSIFGC